MKIINNFISNSSSCSFIIIAPSYTQENFESIKLILNNYDKIPIFKYGNYQFGWEIENYNDFFSKLNFCYLQAKYIREDYYEEMITNVLENDFNKEIETLKENWEESFECYIDHQSNASEGRNTQMFDCSESLRNFLYSSDSYIHTDNDNH
jgi:hypothetical protein